MPHTLNVLLVAEESAGMHVLRALAQSSHHIVAVMASPSKNTLSGASVWKVAENLGLETWPAKLVKDAELGNKLRTQNVDILLNVHSLYVIHRAVLEAPKIGAFNMHPGPLPRYAGLNAVSWAIYRGECTHGVTIHKIVPEVDAGAIVYQSVLSIDDQDSALSLYQKCVKEGVKLMLQLLEVAAEDPDQIPCLPQDLQRREYFGREVPEGGRLSWSSPAVKVVDFARACDYFPFASPWGHPRTTLNGQDVEILKASLTGARCDALPGTIGDVTAEGALVACQDEWVRVHRLRLGNEVLRPMQVCRQGQRLGDWKK